MNEPPILEYATRRKSWPHVPWWIVSIWLASSAVIWRYADWWAYVDTDASRSRKFEVPLWFQLAASLFLGFLLAAALYMVYVIARWYGSKRHKR